MSQYAAGYLGKVAVELADKGKPIGRVQLLRKGIWDHPSAPGGKLVVDDALLDELYTNFKAGVRGPDLPTQDTGAHKDPNFQRSPAWITDMKRDPDALHGVLEFTDADFAKDVESGKVKYISPEILFNYKDQEGGKRLRAVMRGAAWTNLPYCKRMAPAEILNLSEVANEDPDAARDFGDDDEHGDADANNPDLPNQCRSCAKLDEGNCPFQGIDLKVAAADTGLCPQYEPADDGLGDPTDSGTPETDASKKQTNLSEKETQMSDGTKQVSLSEWDELQSKIASIDKLVETTTRLSEDNAAKDIVIEELKTQVIDATKQVALAETARRESELTSFTATAVAEQRITPAQANIVQNILRVHGGQTVKLGEGDDAKEATIETLLSELIESIEPGELDPDDTIEAPVRRTNLAENDKQIDLWHADAKKLWEEGGKKGQPGDYVGQAARNAARAKVGRN